MTNDPLKRRYLPTRPGKGVDAPPAQPTTPTRPSYEIAEPFRWSGVSQRGLNELKGQLEVTNEARAADNPPSSPIQMPSPHRKYNYKEDILDEFYKNYPGGSGGAIGDAGKQREELGIPRNNVRAKLGSLDPRTLGRDNLFLDWSNPMQASEDYGGGRAGTLGGRSHGTIYRDSAGNNFPMTSIFPSPGELPRNQYSPVKRSYLDEELFHPTQTLPQASPRDLLPRANPRYVKKSNEMAAKFTRAKHRYVESDPRGWGREEKGVQVTPAPVRTTPFKGTDADNIINKMLTEPENEVDGKMREFLMTPEGRRYIETNRAEFKKFLLQTVQNGPKKKEPPGFNYAPTRMHA
jgi:hypothetical protein